MFAKSLQLYLPLCDLMDDNPPGSTVHGILQARILQWSVMPSSRGSSWPGVKPASLKSPALAGWFFTTGVTREAFTRPDICLDTCQYHCLTALWNSWFFKTCIPHIFFCRPCDSLTPKEKGQKSFFFFLPWGPLLLWYSISFRSWKPSKMVEWRSDKMPTLG